MTVLLESSFLNAVFLIFRQESVGRPEIWCARMAEIGATARFAQSMRRTQIAEMFELLTTDPASKARRARLTTAHGAIETPAFMPVGTQGTVKGVSPHELRELEAQIILGNTYHLFVRPGMKVMRHFGGLHRFMNWDGPLLTDSGGYQIFSLAKLRKITEDGVQFQNHLDGTPTFISPESAMEIQTALGSDIAMVLDECPPYPCEHDYAARSLELTARWARRCKQPNVQRPTLNVQRSTEEVTRQLVFGIVQGGTFADLRRASAEATVQIGFDGYAIGGVSVVRGDPGDWQSSEAREFLRIVNFVGC